MARPADKLQFEAATIPPLVGLARSKQDPINFGHGAQYYNAPRQPGPTNICNVGQGEVSVLCRSQRLEL